MRKTFTTPVVDDDDVVYRTDVGVIVDVVVDQANTVLLSSSAFLNVRPAPTTPVVVVGVVGDVVVYQNDLLV